MANVDTQTTKFAIDERPLWRQILPLPDRRSYLVYFLMFACFGLQSILFWGGGFSIQADRLLVNLVGPIVALISGMLFRRAGWARTGASIEMLGLMGLIGWTLLLVQYPLAAVSIGQPDLLLLAADKALGFDWLSFARHFQGPHWTAVLMTIYASMRWEFCVIPFALSFTGKIDRAWSFVTASFIAIILCVAPFPFFAARGLFVGCGLRSPNIKVIEVTCDYGRTIVAVHDHGVRAIETWMTVGLVSFPSFHVAAAILMSWALWPLRFARLPVVTWNSIMCIGAIVMAGHYFIDVLGGAIVAGLSLSAVRYLLARANRSGGDFCTAPTPAT